MNQGILQIAGTAALPPGDVSITGNSTLQAGINGLNLANNIIITSGVTATVDNYGNTITLSGPISETAPSGSLTAVGSGTLILTASNTFTGTTTINGGTLQLGNGGASGSLDGPITTNATLAIALSGNVAFANVVSGSGNLNQCGPGNTTLTATNFFTGTTVVSGGTLTDGSGVSLQDSTLNYNNQGGVFSFGTLTASTLGGLSGSQNLLLLNSTSGAVALTVGNNNQTTTYSGNLNDLGLGGSLTCIGNGTFTLTGSNSYTGATTVNDGTVVSAAGGSINGSAINLPSLVGSTLDVNGGTIIAGGTATVSNVLGSDNLFGDIGLGRVRSPRFVDRQQEQRRRHVDYRWHGLGQQH